MCTKFDDPKKNHQIETRAKKANTIQPDFLFKISKLNAQISSRSKYLNIFQQAFSIGTQFQKLNSCEIK